MRCFASIVLITVTAAVFADRAAGRGVAEKKNIVPVAGHASGGNHWRHGRCWHRSAGQQLTAPGVPTVRTSNVEQFNANIQPAQPDVINGLNWYLNGRGYFGD